MSEHRVSMLGASWRRFEDPTRSRDPRVRAVLASLAAVSTPAPRAEFRSELRAQLVAITPRIITESAAAPELAAAPKSATAGRRAARPVAAPPRHSDAFVSRLRRIPIRRPLVIAASVLTAFAVLLGGAVYMSRKALPGDALYGLKRASENFQLATAGSDTEKAHDYLSFAATRAKEVRALLSRAGVAGVGPQAGGIDAGTAANIRSTLASADADVKSASKLLGDQAVRSQSGKPLDAVTQWGPSQLTRLNDIAAAMPAGSLQARTMSSANLVGRALVRAETLAPAVDCACLTSAGSDDLGPVPCTTCDPVALPTGPAAPPGGSNKTVPGTASNPSGTAAAPGPNATNTDPDPDNSGTGSSPSPTSGLHLPTILPSLPNLLPTATLPVTVKSCAIDASLGSIVIGLGLCPLSIGITNHP